MLKSVPEFSEPKSVLRPKASGKMSVANISLILSVIVFIASLAYWVQTQSLTTQSSASVATSTVDQVPTTTVPKNKYPKTYMNQPVPENLYTEAGQDINIKDPDKISYVNKQIVKYYIYGEISSQNGMGEPPPVGNLVELDQAIRSMEEKIKPKYFSSANFGYINIWFGGENTNPDLKKLYDDPEAKAKEIVARYQQLFVLGELSPQQIIDASNNDAELKNFTSPYKNKFLDKYSATDSLFPEDDTFNTFLFSQPANQISDIHDITDGKGQKQGYVIVYPDKITKLNYDSLDLMIKEKENEFGY